MSYFWNNRPENEIVEHRHGRSTWYNELRQYHRIDGPAVIWIQGDKWWYINGKRHREDGPAVELTEGHKEWWLNGIRYSEDGYKSIIRQMKIERLLEEML